MPADTKMTIEEVRDKVESEGLGYAIAEYMKGDSIADPKLADLWDEAARAIAAVDAYIEEHAEDVEEESAPDPSEVVKVDESILCDTTPEIFADVTKTEKYGLKQIDAKAGGTLRLNPEGGRFAMDPELYFRGEFDLAELEELMAKVGPHVAAHVPQSVAPERKDGSRFYLSFPRG